MNRTLIRIRTQRVYVSLAATLGISAVDDQMFGGSLMWSMSHMYLLPILLILHGLSRHTARERDEELAGTHCI